MPLPMLTPLQSRFAASLAASAILLLLYFSLTKPHFAYAVELDSRIPPDHNHPIISDLIWDLFEHDTTTQDLRNELRARAPSGVSALANNAPQNLNINPGETQNWMVPKQVVLGPHGIAGTGLPGETMQKREAGKPHTELRREANNKLYISVNTCLQPSAGQTVRRDSDESIPPQLSLFVSQSSSNQRPGSNVQDANQQTFRLDGGYALATLDADDDVFIGVSAPNASAFSGEWNYAIAASIDTPFYTSEDEANLFFVDADNHAALLISNDTTQANSNSTVYKDWMSMRAPWGLFAHPQDDRSIYGVRNSFCGLVNNAGIIANLNSVQNQNVVGMTNRGLGGKPKEQFYITALDANSTYWGFLAQEGNSSASGEGVVGGGGKVWRHMNFTTKQDNNCALMYNLSFCSEVAYAVPTNPNKYSPLTGLPDLAALYDSNAASLYRYFNYSLQQIPCNTTSTAQYSLARNCDDCARAYKAWLCAVTIPRCEDYSNDAPYLKPRNVAQPFVNGSTIQSQTSADQSLLHSVATNSSRNPIIDHDVRPGPYKEVLPCEDLCYDLVQSCPAALGFGCPYAGRGLEDSYGKRNRSGFITCSYLGAAYYLSGSEMASVVFWEWLFVSVVVAGFNVFV